MRVKKNFFSENRVFLSFLFIESYYKTQVTIRAPNKALDFFQSNIDFSCHMSHVMRSLDRTNQYFSQTFCVFLICSNFFFFWFVHFLENFGIFLICSKKKIYRLLICEKYPSDSCKFFSTHSDGLICTNLEWHSYLWSTLTNYFLQRFEGYSRTMLYFLVAAALLALTHAGVFVESPVEYPSGWIQGERSDPNRPIRLKIAIKQQHIPGHSPSLLPYFCKPKTKKQTKKTPV